MSPRLAQYFMKKILILIAIIIILVLAGLILIPKKETKITEKSTKDLITELLNKKYNSQLIVEVITDTGTFAKGSYNEPAGGGGLWFAAKTARGWELASVGNGIVPCADINKYNFPKEIIPQCLDTQNGNKLITR
jgi:hypothetical protein